MVFSFHQGGEGLQNTTVPRVLADSTPGGERGGGPSSIHAGEGEHCPLATAGGAGN